MLKKLAVLTAALAISAPALADHGRHDRGNHYGHYKHSYQYRPAPRHVVVVHRPAPVYYRPAPVYYRPAPVYYRPAPAPAPRPVVLVHRHDPLPALLFGAVLGAAVVHHAVTH